MTNKFCFLPPVFFACVLFCLSGESTAFDCVTGNVTVSSSIEASSPPTVTASGDCILDINASITANGAGPNGIGPALLVQDSAIVTLLTGMVSANGSGGSDSTARAAIRLQDDSVFTMLGGSVTGAGSAFNIDRAGIIAEDNSTAFLYGGTVVAAGSGGGVRNEIIAEGNSTIYVFGSEFNLSFGEVVSLGGQLTGVLDDGTSIDWQFSRAQGARIILAVPEPSSVLLGCGMWVTMCLRRRRSV